MEQGHLDKVDEEVLNKLLKKVFYVTGKYDNVVERDGKYFVVSDYRDVNTGDKVQVEIGVIPEGAGFAVDNIRIKNVKKFDEEKSQEAKEYTDEEIQAFMQKYIKKQTQFTDGILMLFDKDNEKMRNLKLDELTKKVNRLGVFYSSRAKFVDADSGDLLDVDISVENKDGALSVQALRIRDIRQAPKK